MERKLMRITVHSLGILLLAASAACGRSADPYPERLPIGHVQGRVTDDESITRHPSPLRDETVTVRGVVHLVLRWRTMSGEHRFGMMIQDLPAEADGDPLSSDGLFVYLDRSPAMPHGEGIHKVRVGDVLTLRGKVNERYNQTELGPVVVLDAKTGGDVDKLLPATDLVLSPVAAQTERTLKRHEGMRVSLPAGALAVGGRHDSRRNGDRQIPVTPAANPILARERPAERRIFRDPHPLDDIPERLHDNGNGLRLVLGSLALAVGDGELPAVHTGTRFTGALTGGLHYAYGSHVLQVASAPATVAEADPSTWRIPFPEGPRGLRVASFNVENLYDFRNDPADGCDFAGDEGCSGVRAPFDYLPADEAAYLARVDVIARQIVGDLSSPDILLVQEVEDQDIGRKPGEKANGQLDALEDLVERVVALGGPAYAITSDRQGADTRGITCAFLYDPAKFGPVAATAGHALLGSNPALQVSGEPFPLVREVRNPKAFNATYVGQADNETGLPGVFSRAVQVLGLRENGGAGRTLWLLNNHFSSGPDGRVERRRQQAALNAGLAKILMEAFPDDAVIMGGDLNVFPRPDDPFDPPSDQLGPLYEAGLSNAWDWIVARDPANAYSYVYGGEAGTLDHLFLSPKLASALRHATFLHINADWSDGAEGEAPRRGSDHDPLLIDLAW
jgi:predicted extracellular nuclease